MPQSFFIWNNVDCRAKGVFVRSAPPIIRPEERASHSQIPGLSGDFTLTEGEYVYNSYIQTVSITVRGAFRVREVYDWLRGAGYITFSGEPEVKQKARVIGAITLNRISRNQDRYAGEVQFYCQPLKEWKREQAPIVITGAGATVKNEGDVFAKPLIMCIASGTDIDIEVSGDGTPADNGIAVTGLSATNVIWIDCETQEVWNGTRTATITEKSAGNFPVLGRGENTITITGCSRVEIQVRERFL